MNPFYQEHLNAGFLNVNLDMKHLSIWREHLFEEQGSIQTALFAYKKEKLINNALRDQFYSNEKLIAEMKKYLG